MPLFFVEERKIRDAQEEGRHTWYKDSGSDFMVVRNRYFEGYPRLGDSIEWKVIKGEDSKDSPIARFYELIMDPTLNSMLAYDVKQLVRKLPLAVDMLKVELSGAK